MTKKKTALILACLEETYAGTATALKYNTPFELLVAVILSAQCTDERVNKVHKEFFLNITNLKSWQNSRRKKWKISSAIVDYSGQRRKTFWQLAENCYRNITASYQIMSKT